MTNLRYMCTRKQNLRDFVFQWCAPEICHFSYKFFKSEFASQLSMWVHSCMHYGWCQILDFFWMTKTCFLIWFPSFHLVVVSTTYFSNFRRGTAAATASGPHDHGILEEKLPGYCVRRKQPELRRTWRTMWFVRCRPASDSCILLLICAWNACITGGVRGAMQQI
jgi:hypothetical protein